MCVVEQHLTLIHETAQVLPLFIMLLQFCFPASLGAPTTADF
jgi:hypothetical protein